MLIIIAIIIITILVCRNFHDNRGTLPWVIKHGVLENPSPFVADFPSRPATFDYRRVYDLIIIIIIYIYIYCIIMMYIYNNHRYYYDYWYYYNYDYQMTNNYGITMI